MRQVEGPRRALCFLKKPLKGSETETRELLGGTEENSVSPMRGFHKKETEKKLVSGLTCHIFKSNVLSLKHWSKLVIDPGTGMKYI